VGGLTAPTGELDWYAQRFKIQPHHKVLKPGCQAERSRLRTAERLTNQRGALRHRLAGVLADTAMSNGREESPFIALAGFGPTKLKLIGPRWLRSIRPTRARRPFDASVDYTEARNSDTGCRDRHAPAGPSPQDQPQQKQESESTHKQTPFTPNLIHDTCQTEPALAMVVDAWDRLPKAVRAGIVAMVKAASGK
jgi:hypothetical protein